LSSPGLRLSFPVRAPSRRTSVGNTTTADTVPQRQQATPSLGETLFKPLTDPKASIAQRVGRAIGTLIGGIVAILFLIGVFATLASKAAAGIGGGRAYVETGGKKYDAQSGKRIVKQDGKTYHKNWLGQWVADKTWLGSDKVERDWLGNPKVERNWLGQQRIERTWLGSPVVPPERPADKGACFITTACIQARGLADNCADLTTLRSFRDGYVRSLPEGDRIIREYYEVAPRILVAIAAAENASEVYCDLYARLVAKSVALICAGKNVEAFSNYVEVVNELKHRHLDGATVDPNYPNELEGRGT